MEKSTKNNSINIRIAEKIAPIVSSRDIIVKLKNNPEFEAETVSINSLLKTENH